MESFHPWLDRRILAYAHQGGAWEGPSSTLFSMAQALEGGANALELDVHATKDRQLVVCHDASVDRTTTREGRIADLTLREVKALDPAYWFIEGADVTYDQPNSAYPYRGRAPKDPEFQIATLREVLEAFPKAILNLDIKETAPTVEPYEQLLADELGAFGRSDNVIVASFLDPATDAFHAYAPHIGVSAGTIATAQCIRALHNNEPLPSLDVVAFQVPESYGDTEIVNDTFIAAAHEAGIAVHVWTINDQVAMDRLIALSVDGIISDVPSLLVERLEAHDVLYCPSAHTEAIET